MHSQPATFWMSLLTQNLVATTVWFVVRKPIRDFWVEQHKTSHFHCKGKGAEQEITLAAVSLWRAQIRWVWMHSKVLILAKAPLRGCLICELKWSWLSSSCSRWTEMRETFWLIKHTLIHRVKEQGVISCGQSPSSAECWRQCVRLKGF